MYVERLNVSVVVPAYNAEKYLGKAIKSAVVFSEVKEVIIIDDGSQDSTFKLCCRLREQNSKIKIYQHPARENKGASASRNLGIHMATADFISFLDADDFYLPNRFDAEKTILLGNSDVHGVYGATAAHFISELGKERFTKAKMRQLTTISGAPSSNELIYVLLGSSEKHHGHFHLDALTVRKTAFDRSGLFDETLHFAEDTDLAIRMAVTCTLVAGIIETPVAMRGVHDRNRITNSSKHLYRSWAVAYNKLYIWGGRNGMPEEARLQCLKKSLIRRTYNESFFKALKFLLSLKKNHPELRRDSAAYRTIVFGVFGDNLIGKIYIKISNIRRLASLLGSSS